MSAKKDLRIKYKKLRGAMTEQEVRVLSEQICKHIRTSSLYRQAEQIYFYYPLEQEVNLLSLAMDAINQGKQVAFPKVSGDKMDFYQVSSLTEFKEGCFHVMEPMTEQAVNWEEALVLCPGLVFDRQGNRIGYGKAYYDRYFAQHEAMTRVGIAYAFQLEDSLESEPQDQKMQYLFTNTGFLNCI